MIDDIADAYGKKLEEASKSKVANRGAEAIADEIAATYPFHPRLKNVIALFKENEQFKQTRGLIELVSRLLRSVWDRQSNDVFLIGPQHFDLSIAEVRDKLTEISGMRDVIAKDLWDAQQSAHAQVIDLSTGKEAATQGRKLAGRYRGFRRKQQGNACMVARWPKLGFPVRVVVPVYHLLGCQKAVNGSLMARVANSPLRRVAKTGISSGN